MSELHTNSPSRTARVSMSGNVFSNTENNPRPWLCMVRHDITRCIVTSAHLGSYPKSTNWSTWFLAVRVTLFSFASAPGANAHTADAQLPAYCRIDGRNDTLSGRKLPRIG